MTPTPTTIGEGVHNYWRIVSPPKRMRGMLVNSVNEKRNRLSGFSLRKSPLIGQSKLLKFNEEQHPRRGAGRN